MRTHWGQAGGFAEATLISPCYPTVWRLILGSLSVTSCRNWMTSFVGRIPDEGLWGATQAGGPCSGQKKANLLAGVG
jgi:hypothetical protein